MLTAHWTAWLGQRQGHSTRVFCVVLLIASPFLSVSFFFAVLQTIVDNKLLCQQREQCCCCRRRVCFFSYVVEGCCQPELKLHYIFRKRLPDVSFWSPACWVGVACHRALLSPQWLTTLSRGLPTDRCWLTNQQLSTTNLCCRPSRLTAFLCHSH